MHELSGASYIDRDTAELAARELGMPPSRVYEAITLYDMLSDTPRGRYVVEVCDSPPCHYVRGLVVAETLERLLGISMGETTPDGMFMNCTPFVFSIAYCLTNGVQFTSVMSEAFSLNNS